MRARHAIPDSDWARIEHLLPGRPGQPGWVGGDNRLFVDAVLWIARTGAPGATCRIERSKRELTQSDWALDAIARDVGFGTTQRLYEVFCRELGIRPGEYRRQRHWKGSGRIATSRIRE